MWWQKLVKFTRLPPNSPTFKREIRVYELPILQGLNELVSRAISNKEKNNDVSFEAKMNEQFVEGNFTNIGRTNVDSKGHPWYI